MATTKLTLNLPADLVKRLKEDSERLGISMTEAIRRSLETDLFLTDEENAGSKILLERKDNTLVQVVRR